MSFASRLQPDQSPSNFKSDLTLNCFDTKAIKHRNFRTKLYYLRSYHYSLFFHLYWQKDAFPTV